MALRREGVFVTGNDCEVDIDKVRLIERVRLPETTKVLDPCSPEEIAAWEAWAKDKGYDMHEHPLHYLFMDKQTDAARMGWKAGLAFARATVKSVDRASA